MQVTCFQCQRHFDLDDALVAGAKAAQCQCGARLNLAGPGEAPSQLGKYVLIHLIAKGGMGEIYYGRTQGVEGFAREVAVKRMLPHLASDRGFIDMMIKEAKLTVLLNHPNIVQVYDLAREGNDYYIAMEYVPGIMVSTLLEQTRAAQAKVPVALAVHIVRNLLSGLNYAHHFQLPSGEYKSIVHRDITPQNIMITQRAMVKITDFGIAKAVGEISTTNPGIIKGKLGYLAPEQLMGHLPDHRVDLFCAGIILWELLALKRLFKGLTEVDTFNLIAQCNVPDLSIERPDMPPALMEVIKKALARNPEDRYQRADEIITAINKAIAPASADDYAHEAEEYLRAHPELFAGLYLPSEADAAGEKVLTDVTRLTRPLVAPAPGTDKAPGWMWGAALGAGLLAVGGLGAAGYVLLRPAPSVPVAAVAPAPAPAAPAPVPAPVPAAPSPAAPAAVGAPAAAGNQPVAPAAPAAPAATAAPVSPAPAPAAEAPPSRRSSRRPRHDDSGDKPLTGAEIQAVIMHHQRDVVRCLKQLDTKTAPAQVAAKISIASSGKVTEVSFEPALEGKASGCLHDALMGMRFRSHPLDGLEVTIPLKLKVF